MPINEQVLEAQLATSEQEHPSGSIDVELDQLLTSDPASREQCPATTFSVRPGCCF